MSAPRRSPIDLAAEDLGDIARRIEDGARAMCIFTGLIAGENSTDTRLRAAGWLAASLEGEAHLLTGLVDNLKATIARTVTP